jgi:hypothetical protein
MAVTVKRAATNRYQLDHFVYVKSLTLRVEQLIPCWLLRAYFLPRVDLGIIRRRESTAR